ncbi:MAG: S9 family peptidase [Chloroflexota bacterium]
MSNDQSGRQPLTLEQLVEHERPVDAQINPAGDRIAYVVAPVSKDVSKDEEHGISTIWMVGASQGEQRQFTGGQWEDTNPRWSPDGKQIAFFSDRAKRGKKSVYVMPSDGGEAIRLFDQEGSMRDLQWSPNGKYISILFTDPESEEERKRKEEKDDVNVWDRDRKWQRLWIIDLESREATAVSPEALQVWGYCWSPDSERLAINTTTGPRINDTYGITAISLLSREGGDPETIHEKTGVAYKLTWSHDGKQLAYCGAKGRVVLPEHLFVLPVEGGEPVDLLPDLDGTIYGLAAVSGGKRLGIHIARGTGSTLATLNWDGSKYRELFEEPAGSFPSMPTFAESGTRVAGVWEDSANAPDVYCHDLVSGAVKRRTHLNPELEDAALGELELVRWQTGDGLEVEGILLKPYGYEQGTRYPMVVVVHGGPTWYWADQFFATWHEWAHYLAGRGYAVLMPNPRGSTGRGSDFVNALFSEIGRGEYTDIMAGVDAMIERGIADPDRLGIGGWSWGGYMTAWAVTQTDRFKAAVMGAGLPNMITDNSIGDIPSANLSYFEYSPYEDPDSYWERSPIRYIKKCETPVLILHGEADDRVNFHQGLEMYVALRELSKEHQFVTYPREGHSIQERKHQYDLLTRVGDWFDKHLK